MTFKYAYIFPILCPVWFYSTITITYIIFLYNKDVTPSIPYISETGTWPPESCVFGFMINLGSIILAMTMYVRYRQVRHTIERETSLEDSLKKKNWISLVVGLTGSFGLCVLANFQQNNVFVVHVIGAILAFGAGSVYQCIQTDMSFQLYPVLGCKKVNILRLICAVVSCITFCTTFAFTVMLATGEDDDERYRNRLVGTSSEWILSFTMIFFSSLYKNEFRDIWFSEPLLIEKNERAQSLDGKLNRQKVGKMT